MNTTVLVGTDGTPRAQIAVDRAAALAASVRAKLIVLSVVPAPVITTSIGPRGVDAVVAMERQRREDAERAVRAGALAAEALGVQTTPVLLTAIRRNRSSPSPTRCTPPPSSSATAASTRPATTC